MSLSRDVLRQEAKKEYKKQTKGVPKRQRIAFPEFYKRYKAHKLEQKTGNDALQELEGEDFNFEDLVNVNDLSQKGEDIDE